jgi:hypothetical protein
MREWIVTITDSKIRGPRNQPCPMKSFVDFLKIGIADQGTIAESKSAHAIKSTRIRKNRQKPGFDDSMT